ncbi:hypothetical protein ABT158_36515 [Nonomuraea sp. NPDC001636]|uniref:hypothetical protein n=1 Tax=Nonomuraea sp. NPDC001636 TaxID=3154391 RepID=UPI00332ED0A9
MVHRGGGQQGEPAGRARLERRCGGAVEGGVAVGEVEATVMVMVVGMVVVFVLGVHGELVQPFTVVSMS